MYWSAADGFMGMTILKRGCHIGPLPMPNATARLYAYSIFEMGPCSGAVRRKWQWSGIITNPNRKNGFQSCMRYRASTASLAHGPWANSFLRLATFVVTN